MQSELVQSSEISSFMARFGEQFFDRAIEYMEPEYTPESPLALQQRARLAAQPLLRRPFPDQAEAIQAAAAHLFEYGNKMVFLCADMGTGKTLMGSTIPLLAPRPLRTLIVCPPHLVHKWAREIEKTVPNAKAYKINHAGANSALAKAFRDNPGKPLHPEYWVIGRVRMRMGYAQKPAIAKRDIGLLGIGKRTRHVCPHCGGEALRAVTSQYAIREGLYDLTAETDVEAGEPRYFVFAEPEYFTSGRRTCEWIRTRGAHPRIAKGCGDALWQAARFRDKTPQELLLDALKQFPGVGEQKARAIASLENLTEIIDTLDNGVLHPKLKRILGPKTSDQVSRYLQSTGFTIGAGDYAPAYYIKNRIRKGWFDDVIFDELHELKGDNSAQGVAYGVLAGHIRKVIGLTGTLVDGYAHSLHPLLFRADPKRMLELGYGAHDGARFQREMGVIKEIAISEEEDGLKTAKGRRKVRRQTKNLPGLHPRVITELLLPNAIFVELKDIEAGLQALGRARGMEVRLLPSYREVFVRTQMPDSMRFQVNTFCEEMLQRMQHALRLKDKSLVGPVVSTLLYYPDGAFQDVSCTSKRKGLLGVGPAVISPDALLPKETQMIELLQRDVASEKRKVLIYTSYSGKRDLTRRYAKLAQQAGFKSAVLDARVPTEYREIWVEDRLAEGVDVVVCNPELVKTGLDLLPFTTLMFMQTGMRVDTLLQASRRSYRIGQEDPIRVYFLGYDETPQMQAMALMAKKVTVAQQAKGDISLNGLLAAVPDDDDAGMSMMDIANAILDSRRDKTHDAITGAITSLDQDSMEGEFRASSMGVLQSLLAPVAEQVSAIDCSTLEPDPGALINIPARLSALHPQPLTDAVPAPVLVDVFNGETKVSGRPRRIREEKTLSTIIDAPVGAQFRLF